MKTYFKKWLLSLFGFVVISWFFLTSITQATEATEVTNNFSTSLWKWIESVGQYLDAADDSVSIEGNVGFIIQKAIDVLFPVIVVIWVLMAMIGLYQVLTSSEEWKLKEGISMILYGTIWIIIMYSAKYLSTTIFSDLFRGGVGNAMTTTEWIGVLYDKIWFPFIKIIIYLSLGFLVILMIIRVFTYITAQDDTTKKKALGVIIWTTIGMLFITAAQQIVEAVYGKQDQVLKEWASSLSEIWTQILNPNEIPIFFSIINRSLGLVSFVLLILILIQTYKMLTKPDDAATFTALKKTIVYALWGIILIGSAYLISNFLIFN